ncbi:MAG: heme lyase CcmF/NrfE family subunit [Myxococcota bacterium]
MAIFGELLLYVALISIAGTAVASVVGAIHRSERWVESARYGTYAVFGILTCASMALMQLFVAEDYAVKYVHHYSDRSMPLFYKITAFWGGQDGSLLFWVWVLSSWAAMAVHQNRQRNRAILPYTISALMVVCGFFVVTMIFAANPFETYLGTAPTDGRGLNPLLQNPYMVIHPPTLYLGYIGWTIPYCFAIGALAHGRLDYEWIGAMRRWCLVAWILLTVGLILGGLWAYEELGWGGYWAWDPVENAAFMPWLTGTAFIHSIQVQERRQMYKSWNLLLIILTFLLTMLGTMMTRSGVVQSVHAFAQSNIGSWFGWFIGGALVISFGLLLWRLPQLRPGNQLESVLSREFAFLANNWILLAAAFFVTFATLFPSLFKFVSGQTVNVGPSFYNIWMVPIGLVLLFLTGVGPLLSWRKSTGRSILQQFAMPSALGLVTGGILFALNFRDAWALTSLSLSAFVFATIGQEFWRGAQHRMRKSEESAALAVVTLMQRAKRRYGGYVVHFGLAMMFVGFAGNAFKAEQDVQLSAGETHDIRGYTLRFDKLRFADDGQKNMVTAEITVLRRGGDDVLAKMTPAKWFYRKPEDQVTTEVDKLSSLQEDLYLVLGGFDGQEQSVALQVKVNPLVNYVWLGTAFMMLGFGIAVWPDRRQATARVSVGQRLRPAAALASLILGVLSSLWAFGVG